MPELRAALRFLGQPDVAAQSPDELLAAAAKVWKLTA
jgi:hypothetical protein